MSHGALNRHTMGNDWGGRPAANPAGAPRVSREAVLQAAAEAGVEVKRPKGAWSMWWVRRPDDVWRTLATTNFLACESLRALPRDTRNKPNVA
jgi:hypothetical protein